MMFFLFAGCHPLNDTNSDKVTVLFSGNVRGTPRTVSNISFNSTFSSTGSSTCYFLRVEAIVFINSGKDGTETKTHGINTGCLSINSDGSFQGIGTLRVPKNAVIKVLSATAFLEETYMETDILSKHKISKNQLLTLNHSIESSNVNPIIVEGIDFSL